MGDRGRDYSVCSAMPFLDLGQELIRDLAGHLRGQLDPLKILQLVMDIPGAHPSRVQGEDLFLNSRYVTLIFGDELWLEFPIAVPGHVHLEFAVLAFEGFSGMTIALIIRSQIPLLIFLITEAGIQFRLHEFLQDVFKTFLEKGIDIRNDGDVVF